MMDYLRQLNFVSMMLRIALAMIVGGSIGLERERKNRGAGFRTYMLVALGASITVILSQYLNQMLCTDWNVLADEIGIRTDVSRFGAQVINGVGFLGAGTIIVTSHQEVKGLTTAAGLWASACLGLAVGAGFFECVIICYVLIFLIMRILPLIEDSVVAKSRHMNVNVEMEAMDRLGNVVSRLKAENIRIYEIDIDRDSQLSLAQAGAVINILLPKPRQHTEIIAMLSTVEGVIATEEI